MTGDYFRTREAKVYSFFLNELLSRSQKFTSNKNHAKVTLCQIDKNYIVIEGSANFTSNPRIEQFVISNSIELYNFHKEWMNKILTKTNF